MSSTNIMTRGLNRHFPRVAHGLCNAGISLLSLILTSPCLFADQCSDLRADFRSETSAVNSQSPLMFAGWLIEKSKYECALQYASQSAREDPKSWRANYYTGLAAFRLGQLTTASNYLTQAVTLDPTQVASQLLYGGIEEDLSHFQAAETIYRAALQRLPEQPDIMGRLASVLSKEQRYREAIGIWRRILGRYPRDENVPVLIAAAYSDLGDQTAAIDTAKEFLKEHPRSAGGFYTLGVAYSRAMNYSAAISAFETALDMDPKDDLSRIGLAKAEVTLLRYDHAANLLQSYLATNDHDLEALIMLGRAEMNLGNLDQADAMLRRAIAENPQSYDAQYLLGVVLMLGKKDRDAMKFLLNAAAIKPGAVEPHFQLSRVYRRLGWNDQAAVQLKRIDDLRDEDKNLTRSTVLGGQGSAELDEGKIDDAIKSYSEALGIDGHNGKLYYDLSLAFRKKGNAKAELDALLKAESLDPSLAAVHNQLGVRYMQLEKLDQAETELSRAVALEPEFTDALNNLAVVLGREGKLIEAEMMSRRTIEIDGAFVEGYVNLGLILAAQGHLLQALETESEALKRSPLNREAASAKHEIELKLRAGASNAQ